MRYSVPQPFFAIVVVPASSHSGNDSLMTSNLPMTAYIGTLTHDSEFLLSSSSCLVKASKDRTIQESFINTLQSFSP